MYCMKIDPSRGDEGSTAMRIIITKVVKGNHNHPLGTYCKSEYYLIKLKIYI